MDKTDLRRTLRQRRRALGREARIEASARAVAHLVASELWATARCVAAYAAAPGELRLDALIAQREHRVIALPRVLPDHQLAWHAAGGALVRSELGLREPLASAPAVAPEDIDLWLLPAVGVDGKGHRLGQGGGYYDRALAGRDAVRVAVVFGVQCVDQVPVEPTDVPVHAVLSEAGLRWVAPR